jgi:LEA14-like dessication related protein
LSVGVVLGILVGRKDMDGRRGSNGFALGAACLAFFATGLAASSTTAGGRDEITLALKEKFIRNLSSSGLVLAFHVVVANPSPAPFELVRYRYRVRIEQKEYINTETVLDAPLSIPAEGQTLIALPVKITYDLLRTAIGPIEGQALCDIVGEMVFQGQRKREQKVPFAFSGEFPIFQDPEVDLLPLKVLDLTVGGADVVLHPRFKNFNVYDLIIDTIDFELYFNGHLVFAGGIPGDKSLPRTGEKTFSLPFLLDFFETGDAIREDFGKDEFPCRFTGRIEIASVWGRLIIRFDRTQALRLDKK